MMSNQYACSCGADVLPYKVLSCSPGFDYSSKTNLSRNLLEGPIDYRGCPLHG